MASKLEINRRLLVLLPENLAGNTELAQKIHWMASRERMDVLYLVILDNSDHGLSVSRDITTMKAVTESNLIHAGSIQVTADRWFAKLNEIRRPDDTILCHAEQTVKQGFMRTAPLVDYLRKMLGGTVNVIEGYYHPRRVVMSSMANTLLFWLGAVALLVGFTWLELQADSAFPGFAHKLVLAAILIIEVGSVWLWSQIVHR